MLFAAMTASAFAQVEGKMRGGLNLGPCIVKGIGFGIDMQLGYNLKDNMNVGTKLGIAAMAKVDPIGETGTAAANVNFLGTFTYYFNSGESSFAPFVGSGLGVYVLAAESISSSLDYTVDFGNRFGGMLTAGFEIAKFRLAFEYNMIPSSAVKFTGTRGSIDITNDKIKNSYSAVTLGFYFGGGKWKK